jgi:hypothetical protein
VAGAFSYVQSLLAYLNANFSDPNGADPFSTILPSQGGAFNGDSSVTPFTLDSSNIFNPHIYNNYNFAIARVRPRGTAGAAGAAQNVRVFFRLWSTQAADTDYQPSSTYANTPDASGFGRTTAASSTCTTARTESTVGPSNSGSTVRTTVWWHSSPSTTRPS